MAENNNGLESSSLDEKVEDKKGIVDADSTNFNNQNPADEILANPDADLDDANKSTQEEENFSNEDSANADNSTQEKITKDTLNRKSGTASVAQFIDKLSVDGRDIDYIGQNVDIVNPSTKEKFESQRVSVFDGNNSDILTAITQRSKYNGNDEVVAFLKQTGKEGNDAKMEFCINAEYFNSVIQNSDYEDKGSLLNNLGEIDKNGFYHLEAISADISKDINIDSLKFKTTDGKSYGVMFSALGMQINFANAAVIKNPLKLKESGKGIKEGESYPFDIAISSAFFEKGSPSNIVLNTNEMADEVLDNLQVSALRSKSMHNPKDITTMQIDEHTKLVSVPLGETDNNIGFSQLDFRIDESTNDRYVYLQRRQVTQIGDNRAQKPVFLKIQGASFVKEDGVDGKEFLELNLVRGNEKSTVHIPLSVIEAKENIAKIAGDFLSEDFKHTKDLVESGIQKAQRAKDKNRKKYSISGFPVYTVGTGTIHVVAGQNVAGFVRKTEQEAENTENPEEPVNPGNPENPKQPEEPKEEKKEEEKNIPAETEEQPTQTTQEEQSAQQTEKPKKKSWTGFLNKLMGGDTFLGISIAVTSFSCLFPPLAILSGIMLLGFGAAKSGFIDMFEGFSFRKAKLSKDDLLKEIDKQKEREMRKADRQKNKSINKEDKKYLKNVNDLIDERNRLVKQLKAEKLKVDKQVVAENKNLDEKIAKQKELYETILTKVNPSELDIDKSLLSPELNAILNRYADLNQQIKDQEDDRQAHRDAITAAKNNEKYNKERAENEKKSLEAERDGKIEAEKERYNRKINSLEEDIKRNIEYAAKATNKETRKKYNTKVTEARKALKIETGKLNKFNESVENGTDKFSVAWKKADEELDRKISQAAQNIEQKNKEWEKFDRDVKEHKDSYSQIILELEADQDEALEAYRKELVLEQQRMKEEYNRLLAEKREFNDQAKTYSDRISKESQIGTLNGQIDNLDIDIESTRKDRTSGMQAYTQLADEERAEKQKEIDAKNEEDKDLIEGYYRDKDIEKAKKKAQEAAGKPSNGEHALLER